MRPFRWKEKFALWCLHLLIVFHSGAAVLSPFFSHRYTMVVTHSIRVQYNDID